MTLKKLIILLVSAVYIVLSLTGCSNDTNKDSDNTSAEHEAITIMDAQRDYSNLIKLVNEKYPEINIEVIPYRGRNMSAYVKQQLETGSMPDIYSTTQAWNGELQKEHLIDLSAYNVTGLYNSARIDEYIVDGGLYLLPFDYSINGILYNKTLFEENNIDVPTTFKQLREETIPALKQKGIKVANCLLDLPGTGFQYFFNVSSTGFMNTIDGIKWRNGFVDVDSDTFASDNENVLACLDLFQEWIECGMLTYEEGISGDYSATLGDFMEGDVAFLVGAVHRFSQNEDGTGDQYGLLPYLSEDGSQNSFITQPSRFYGLNKELAEEGNEQKLEDALHVLEVLSSNEGYEAINGTSSTNMCSINEFKLVEGSPYAEAMEEINVGHSMAMVYTGWDNYLASTGNDLISVIRGEKDGIDVLKALDESKLAMRANGGAKVYATVTEELNTIQAAQLCGQMFLEATGADAALISYNVYSPDVPALMENSYGANGNILVGEMTEEYIVIFLPTGWSDTLNTASFTGATIKQMAKDGCDTRNTGFKYPYVFLTKDGNPLEDDETYTVVLCGYNKSEKDSLGLVNTGIVGLDAAKDYLLKVGEVSSKTLDDTLLQVIE